MKPIQWIIAVVVLVLMVFAVAFVMQFLGESGTTTDTQPPTANTDNILAFAEMKYPNATTYFDQELNQTGGQHDFLFQNPTDEDVSVTLNSLSCNCASVTLFLASEEWKTTMARSLASEMVKSCVNPLLAVGFAGPPDAQVRDAAAKIEQTGRFLPEKGRDMTFTIPPRAVGWFRVGWPGDKNGTTTYRAEVGTKQKDKHGAPVLEVAIHWVDPAIFVEPILAIGEFPATEMQPDKPKIVNVYLYSTTRLQLNLKAEVVTKWKKEESPMVAGNPEQVPPEVVYMRLPPESPEQPRPRILCAYRIPVLLQERSPDKTRLFPLGSFRMRLRVEFDDVHMEPCFIHGTVLGDVRTAGQLNFSTFQEASGSKEEAVTLYTEDPKLELEIDRDHTWSHLRDSVNLERDKNDEKKTAWKLTAQIKPHSGVKGEFPSLDIDELFDTGVYVKTKGDAARSLRVSTRGTAK